MKINMRERERERERDNSVGITSLKNCGKLEKSRKNS